MLFLNILIVLLFFYYSPITACPQVYYFLHNEDIYMKHLHGLQKKQDYDPNSEKVLKIDIVRKQKKANLIKPTAHGWGLETRL